MNTGRNVALDDVADELISSVSRDPSPPKRHGLRGRPALAPLHRCMPFF